MSTVEKGHLQLHRDGGDDDEVTRLLREHYRAPANRDYWDRLETRVLRSIHEATRRFSATLRLGNTPCPPGTIYCFKCRQPRAPASGMVEFTPRNPTTGNLVALCETCGTVMHRSARLSSLAVIMPGIRVEIREAGARLVERLSPPLNCDERKA